MFSFNWIDGIIVLLVISAIIGGRRLGFMVQIGVIASFFGALFLAGWLYPHLLPIEDRTLLTLVNANLVLLTAIYAGIRGFDLGAFLHRQARKTSLQRLKPLEAWLGIIPSTAAALILIWLLATMVGRMPFEGFSNSVNDARIVQLLTKTLPPVPAVFAQFNRTVDPNSPPRLMAEPRPKDSFAFLPHEVQAAADKAADSIVRITSFGCGGIVTGSGFVVGPELVATNAHVIAGVERPIVKYDGHSFEAMPILFDANLDLAFLRVRSKVHDFTAPALQFADRGVMSNTTVAALGYPGGNYTVLPAIIRNNLTVFGTNIYDIGTIGRDVYEIQSQAQQGSSGGPIVLENGRVAGIIFAQSEVSKDYSYALASPRLIEKLVQAQASSREVGTGACLAS